ncbi:VRR-NUC domain containing protein [uncultured Caudovirales phage]|uniref:VRR-NUC domain containing protein n=1 Tax=uncultured Caudovirales phage TaxID=2100421 RepID=A0A6J5LII2_9CAUD|nr:VRR-NUC domain containing protein [uncultured Caudovirales phage]CAB4132887.1 VRR-NUC domain containing protein [uncultured Caudovirales phage]
MLEKDIEAKVCEYAKTKGVLVYKFTSPARAAVPDRLFIRPDGYMWFCEFKREGQKPTPAQEREHHRLRQHKVSVFVVDNVESGIWMINAMLDMMTMASHAHP